jgi:exopolysaccharide biosynthesis polyprenyl glycosylphosphotransferase
VLLISADLVASMAATSTARSFRPVGGTHSLDRLNTVSGLSSLTYPQLGVLVSLAWVIALGFVGAYQRRRFNSLWDQSVAMLRGAVGLLAATGVASLFTRVSLSRLYVVSALALLLTFGLGGRLVVFALFRLLLRLGILTDRVVLVGDLAQTAEIARHLERTAASRVRVIGTITETPLDDATIARVLTIARQRGLTSVIVCGERALSGPQLRRLRPALAEFDVSLVVAPGTTEALAPTLEFHPIGDLVLLRVADNEPSLVSRLAKGAVDRIGACLILVAASPLLLAIALVIAREGRPVLFRQKRVGRDAKPFRIFKFRSMAVDAEERLHREGLYETYVANGFKLPPETDPRITRVGAMLRKTSLDELPQLLNVIRGEMSLVGPRPVVIDELANYGELARAYTGVKPGLTGYWQINGRSDVGFPERGELDAYYYDHRSFRFDLRILCRTVITVLQRTGAH